MTATYFEWTRCGDASMMGIYLWSENSAKLTLLCVQHGQHTAGCGDASMMGLSLWSENSAKLTLFCAPKAPKMLLTALLARASRETAVAISLRSLGWVDIWISIFGRYLGWAKISISIFGGFCQKQADMALRYGHLEASPTQSGESRYVNVLICIEKIIASFSTYILIFTVTMHQIPKKCHLKNYIFSFCTKIKRD